jgi:acetoin utilization deacetylase AcuC-like enzyme
VFTVTATATRTHETPNHPERPERLEAALAGLNEAKVTPDLDLAEPPEDVDELIRLIHPQRHLDEVWAACKNGVPLDADTDADPAAWSAARLAVGATARAVEKALGGADRALVVTRPPGHHAEPTRAMGFCYFNQIAIAAKLAQTRYNLGRVAIVDIDVHHGNGTQAAFYADPSVLFISLHEDPATCYPHTTGHSAETGADAGLGFNLNLPLPAGTDDVGFLAVLSGDALPRLREFAPDLLLISAGFDAHRDDPLAHLNLTAGGFGQITRDLLTATNVPTVSVLEGGYHLDALRESVAAHAAALHAG